jgi:very-short-patch-repair endonuclease
MPKSKDIKSDFSPLMEDSPPLEGCPQGGVVTIATTKNILTHIHNFPVKRNFIKNLPYNPELKQLARDKRKAGILSEVLFWQKVHEGKFYNIDFDRQRIIGSYVVDFYVKSLGLIIEIDGDSHIEKIEYDAKRQKFLESCGLKIYRIADGDVKNNLDRVLIELEDYIVGEYGETNILGSE